MKPIYWIIIGVLGALVVAAIVIGLVLVGSQRQQIRSSAGALPTSPALTVRQPATAALVPSLTPPALPTPVPPATPTQVLIGESAAPTTSLAIAAAVTMVPVAQATVTSVTAAGTPWKQHPARVTASAEGQSSTDSRGNVTTFVAGNVTDGEFETAWRVPGDGRGQQLTLEFTGPLQVSEIRLVPGYAKIDPNDGTNRFLQNRRVVRVRFEFSDGQEVEAQFADRAEAQPISINDITTTFVRVVILETTAPGTVDGRDYTPISEIEIYGTAL